LQGFRAPRRRHLRDAQVHAGDRTRVRTGLQI
jgi:hypothetical protein